MKICVYYFEQEPTSSGSPWEQPYPECALGHSTYTSSLEGQESALVQDGGKTAVSLIKKVDIK